MVIASLIVFVLAAVWAALLVASIILLGVGLNRMWHRRGTFMAACGGVLVLSLLAAAYLAVVPPRSTVSLDLSRSLAPPKGDWRPYGVDGDMLCFQGHVSTFIKLPHGETFDEVASLVVLQRRKGQISDVDIQAQSLPFEQACAQTDKYLRRWGFNRNGFDQWCADRRAGKPDHYGDDRVFASMRDNTNPSLSLQLRESAGDDWTLMLSAYWPREDGPRQIGSR